MMRRKLYQEIGGYRECFYFAQDLDLWTRLVEHGSFRVLDEVLYRARLHPASISGTYSSEQQRLTRLISAAAVARRAGQDESRSSAGVRQLSGQHEAKTVVCDWHEAITSSAPA